MYFRYQGRKYPLPDGPLNSAKFLEAYTGIHRKIIGAEPAKKKATSGTIAAAIHVYQGSEDFIGLADNTKSVRRRALSDIGDKYGSARFLDLRPRHIRKDLSKYDPHPANSRLKVWRGLCSWSLENGLLETNPAIEVKMRAVPKSDGYIPWTRDAFQVYRNYWSIGTHQRLAFEIMYLTSASIGDACRLGSGNVRDGWIVYRRKKSGSEAVCPFTSAAPLWSEPDGLLIEALNARDSKHMTWMVTEHGGPRSPKAATQWFSKSCTQAGLPDLTSHGIRKGRAAMFKENGATLDQRLAWLGQETESEGRHYSKSADLRKVIETRTESANLIYPSANFST